MPGAFEQKEEEKKEIKKRKRELPAPAELKTILEISDIRDTAKRGREIMARKEGRLIEEDKEEEKDLVPGTESKMEPPPNPCEPPSRGDDDKERKRKFENIIRKMKKFLE